MSLLYTFLEHWGAALSPRLICSLSLQMMQGATIQTVSVQPVALGQTMTTVTQLAPNNWSSGLCDCCEDMGICCFAFWCFPCFQCSTASDFGECLCLPLLDCGSYTYHMNCPIVSLAMRVAVRERYKIPGSICNDCCTVCWCLSCSWCQMAREIKKRKQPVSFVTAHTNIIGAPLMQAQNITVQSDVK
ncbi:cornifelin homolog A-like [Dendrobates tinctorius]|uniref:cornifelin homolog A-like n=1 Tax=Dendrobates tinctorius TaxID=92724 RepID=UPI003CCA6AA7